jgi:hypothetical protein
MYIASSRAALGFLALAAFSQPAWAAGQGRYGGHAPAAAKAHHAPTHSHMPAPMPSHMPPAAHVAGAGNFAPSAPRAVAAPRRPVAAPMAAPVLPLLPITGGLPASVPRVTLHGEGDFPRYGDQYAQPLINHVAPQRRIEPGSFAPVDPRAFIGETPSGRVFMGAPAGVYAYAPPHRFRQAAQRATPYAQPKFIVIGAASGRHMKPVHLTHGVQPSNRFNSEPQVIWLRGDDRAVK